MVLDVTQKTKGVSFIINFVAVELGAIGCDVKQTGRLGWVDDEGHPTTIQTGAWDLEAEFPPRPPGPTGVEMLARQSLSSIWYRRVMEGSSTLRTVAIASSAPSRTSVRRQQHYIPSQANLLRSTLRVHISTGVLSFGVQD